ncbi:hypothetical protein EGR_04905 [Echinococcus granulosus]|uniref:Uncharacterized protein n=1 Tax=Echinococcus granulosus TaxID=6210 RepID=W6UFJ1_ECHGR|nr:hypothetical protein EGR_04905 [Echinococcus granulosus]EUB60195.1 hypothetical protein EGR_04905 [Echinococcus granulosus]
MTFICLPHFLYPNYCDPSLPVQCDAYNLGPYFTKTFRQIYCITLENAVHGSRGTCYSELYGLTPLAQLSFLTLRQRKLKTNFNEISVLFSLERNSSVCTRSYFFPASKDFYLQILILYPFICVSEEIEEERRDNGRFTCRWDALHERMPDADPSHNNCLRNEFLGIGLVYVAECVRILWKYCVLEEAKPSENKWNEAEQA